MRPEQWSRMKEMLAQALERSPEDRRRWVDDHCRDEPELRSELLALLQSESQMGAFLESPPQELRLKELRLREQEDEPGEGFHPQIGQVLGRYEIRSLLGAGGMGRVYLAKDHDLGRPAALKFLSPHLASDPLQTRRLLREARAAAALDHPYICKIYETGEQAGQPFIALEFVAGTTLSSRLRQGALPLAEALRLALEIAEALEKAHQSQIVHRDLKPSNIMIDNDGHAKVMDFGLAKVTHPEAEESEPLTLSGVAMGTAAYMSPEQLRAEGADARSDIFSFGLILLEMATGSNPFRRSSNVETANAILNEPPPPFEDQAMAAFPALLRHTLSKMLSKTVQRRYQSVHEVRTNLQLLVEDSWSPTAGRPPWSSLKRPSSLARRFKWPAWLAAALALGLLIGSLIDPWPGDGTASESRALDLRHRFQLRLPDSHRLARTSRDTVVAISPDGTNFVFSARSRGSRLFLRSAGTANPSPLPQTEGAASPFFSPDGRWIAFFAEGQLVKMSLGGGARKTICAVSSPHASGSWIDQSTIVFSDENSLHSVQADGGVPELLAAPDSELGQTIYRWPHFVRGSRLVLANLQDKDDEDYDDVAIAAISLDDGRSRIIYSGARPRYSPTGHLLYARSGALFAVSFDPTTLQVSGQPRRIIEGLEMDLANGAAQFDVSASGSLLFVEGDADDRALQLGWADRQGNFQDLGLEPLPVLQAVLSPAGDRLAASVGLANHQIWWFDLVRSTRRRMTLEWDNHYPVWNGQQSIIFASTSPGPYNLFQAGLEGQSPPRALSSSGLGQYPSSLSPDRRHLLYEERREETKLDILHLDLDSGEDEVLHSSPFNESDPSVSQDGEWLAYTSDESGRPQVYVEPFLRPGPAVQVSIRGGQEPLWSPSGREIFYRSGESFWRSSYRAGAQGFRPDPPQRLFTADFVGRIRASSISADGQRFLMARQPQALEPGGIFVVLNRGRQ